MFREKYEELTERLRIGIARENAARGWCRVWTSLALDEIEGWAITAGVNVVAEAREIRMPSGLEHTFVQLSINSGPWYVFDGVGVESQPSYFGPESEVPTHLRNSRIDTWIMLDRQHKGV